MSDNKHKKNGNELPLWIGLPLVALLTIFIITSTIELVIDTAEIIKGSSTEVETSSNKEVIHNEDIRVTVWKDEKTEVEYLIFETDKAIEVVERKGQ